MSTNLRLRRAINLLTNQANRGLTAATAAAALERLSRSEESAQAADVLARVQLRRDDLIVQIRGDTSTDLYLKWIVERFTEAVCILESIDVERVAELRRQKQNTAAEFDTKLQQVSRAIHGPVSGLESSLTEVYSRHSNYQLETLVLVGRIRSTVAALSRSVSILKVRPLRLLLFDTRPSHLTLLAVVLFCTTYLVVGTLSSDGATFAEEARADVSAVAQVWQQPQVSLTTRVRDTLEIIGGLATVTPLVLLVVAGLLSLLRRLLFSSADQQRRIKDIEDHVRNLAKQMSLKKKTLLSIKQLTIAREVAVSNKRLTIKNSTINAPVFIAETIENSLNTIEKGNAPDAVKELLSELLARIANAGESLGEGVDQLARDAESLSREASSESPRRKWYELSIEGIQDAAKAIGDVGVPILETTKKLLPLLVQLFP